MRTLLVVLNLIALIYACNSRDEKDNPRIINGPKVVEAKGYVVPQESIAVPKVILIDESKLKKTLVVNPQKVRTNINVHPVGNPEVILAGKPQVITPGKDTFSLPKVVPSIDCPILAKQPKPSMASAFRMKDAATYNIQYLDVDQGMNSSYILAMIEDKREDIWFATNGGGVSKYDGKTFIHYTDKEGLKSNYVLSILEDKKGNIWFGTDGGGVCKYDGTYFTHYTDKEGLSDNTVWSILEDKIGNLWFGTGGGTLNKYDGRSFKHFTNKQGVSNYATSGGGVCKYDGTSFARYTDKEGLSNNVVRSIIEDKRGNLWFGTAGGGISKYDGKSFTYYTQKEGLSSNYIRSIFEDKSGNLWFGTSGQGIIKYDGNRVDEIEDKIQEGQLVFERDQQGIRKENGKFIKSFTYFSDHEGLSNNNVRSILEDQSGNLWFGTYGGGICRYDTKSFLHYTNHDGLGNSAVRSILEDKHGNIWFGTDGGGVCKYDGTFFTNYSENDGLSSNYILSIEEDKTGNLWFGTYGGGVCKYDGKFFTQYTEIQDLNCKTVRSILEDKNGNLWFGTNEGGVCKYDRKSFTSYTINEGLSGNTVWSIFEDSKGSIWFGTDGGGVCKYDGKNFIHFTEREGLSNNIVWSIMEDKSGDMWFGTGGGGLNKYNGKYFTHYTEKEGLSNGTIWSVIQDKSGNIWVSTERGINHFIVGDGDKSTLRGSNPKENFNAEILAYHMEDGLKSEDFFNNSVLLDSKNRVWWGSGKALTMLDLNSFKLDEKVPLTRLNHIYLQENYIQFNLIKTNTRPDTFKLKGEIFEKIKFSDVANFNNYPYQLELPYNFNHLTFCFSAIDWYAPHNIKYQYLLEGLDSEWSNLSEDNKADFRNIPYGKYKFKVKAVGSANKWSETFEYSFVVHPPWWLTWWAFSIYGLFGVTTLIIILRWNSRRLRIKAEELKIKVDEATIEIKEQKHLIEEKHKEITDSINYARRIQRSFLATEEHLNGNLAEYFIFFKPKDIVSGDFYWSATLVNDLFALAVADSTGHGVPGAIMCLLNISSLELAVKDGLTDPAQILNYSRKEIIERLKKDGSAEGGKDGMDCSLCVYDFKNMKLHLAAANNPVWIVRGQEVVEVKGDKMPVGKHDKQDISFTQRSFDIEKGDVIFTLTDGFPDQFGGQKGKKFMGKNLRELLVKNARLSMQEQREILEVTFADWKGNLTQVDDVTVIGIRI